MSEHDNVGDTGYNAYLLHAPCAGRSLKALAARLLGHARILKGEVAVQNSNILSDAIIIMSVTDG